jgi:hypothetical protein
MTDTDRKNYTWLGVLELKIRVGGILLCVVFLECEDSGAGRHLSVEVQSGHLGKNFLCCTRQVTSFPESRGENLISFRFFKRSDKQ